MVEGTEPQNMAKPVGSYIHVKKVSCKELIFVAGQVPVDQAGNVVGVDPKEQGLNATLRNRATVDVEVQVRQTMLNVKAALEAAGASFKNLVRLDTYVVATAMNEYRRVGVVAKHEMLGGVRTPGATVFVAGLMIPEAVIEISAIAAIE
jgi:enamine deaminase RidA (YjgF/YER057c/UK114 family)